MSVLSDEEIKNVFIKWDLDKNGTLSRDEVRAGLAALKLPPTAEGVEKLFNLLDKNSDGVVTLEEFSEMIKQREKEIRAAFDELDLDKSGYLDFHEVQEALNKLSISYDDKVVKDLINHMDTNKDEKVEYTEFRDLLVAVPEASLSALIEDWRKVAVLNISDDVTVAPINKTAPNAALINFVAGAVSSVLSKTSTAPLERVKIINQMHTSKPPSVMRSLITIYTTEGFRGLLRGNLVNLMKSSPENAVKLMVFEKVKELFPHGAEKPLNSAQLFIAGAVGGVAAHASCFPLEVLKTKMAGSKHGTYNGLFDCISKVYASHGIRGFYRGLGAVTLSTIPHSGVTLMSYQMSKDFFEAMSPTGQISASGLMAASAFSTIAGQTVSQPLHVLKVF